MVENVIEIDAATKRSSGRDPVTWVLREVVVTAGRAASVNDEAPE